MQFISVSDLMPPSWHFLADVSPYPELTWPTVSGTPRNGLERAIRRPSLARWRAAVESVSLAKRTAEPHILVSHLPRMGAAANLVRRRLASDTRQIAFAFNFTDLPTGRGLDYFRSALRGIEEFVVFSRYEQSLYARTFDLPVEKFRFLHWAMGAPQPGPKSPLPDALRQSGYVSAIGGEGRDYRTFADAMRRIPHVSGVVVGRPHGLRGIDFPANVTVHSNLPLDATWRIAADSAGMVIPLKTGTTACGHITIVGAQLLGIPLVSTNSQGTSDYLSANTALLAPAGDSSRLAEQIDRLITDPAAKTIAAAAKSEADERSDLRRWVEYFKGLADA